MPLKRETRSAIDRWLMSHQAPDAKQLGQATAQTTGDNDRVMTQIRGLQNLAFTTQRFSDLEESIWGRMGRDTKKTSIWWQPIQPAQGAPGEMGHLLLDALHGIRNHLDSRHDPGEERVRARIYAARLWIRRFVASYLYHRNL